MVTTTYYYTMSHQDVLAVDALPFLIHSTLYL